MDSTTGPDGSAAQSIDRLDSWKEIATFLGRGVTTVHRWEEEEALPVHRHAHAKRGTVFAFKSELETWRSSRDQLPDNSDAAAKANDAPESTEPEHMRVGAVEPPTPPLSLLRLSLLRLLPLAAIASLAIVGLGLVLARTASDSDAINDDMPRPLANDAAYEGYPSLSPDGQFVAFRWSREDAPGIYVKPTRGGAAWVLNLDGAAAANRDSFPKWSPDGRSIAFLREIGSSVWDVRVAPVEGGASRRVTQITSGSVPWMPDGKTLAVADRPAPGEPYSVFLVSIESGHRLRRVTSPPGTFGDWHCAISPDGSASPWPAFNRATTRTST